MFIGYTRVSTDMQKDKGESLPAQADRIRQYANLYNMEIGEIIEDGGYSAKNLKRPGMQKILELVKKSLITGVIVPKLDRLTRSMRDLLTLMELFEKHGVKFVSVAEHIDTTSAGGRMILSMLTVISQWEREVIGERTSEVLRHMRGEGKVYSKDTLYGYVKHEGRMVADNFEGGVIAMVMTMHKNGSSCNGIANYLNSQKIPARKGKWYQSQVQRIVENEPIRREMAA